MHGNEVDLIQYAMRSHELNKVRVNRRNSAQRNRQLRIHPADGPRRCNGVTGVGSRANATTVLGHMTGRQLLRRPRYDVDVEKILAACAKHGVAVEINDTLGGWTWTGAGINTRWASGA